MDIKYYKSFRLRLDQLLKVILEQRIHKPNNSDLNYESLEKLAMRNNDWLDSYQQIYDQLIQRKQILLATKRMKQAKKQLQQSSKK